MRLERAGRALDDVYPAAIAFPTGEASDGEVLVGVGGPVIVLGAVRVGG